MEDPWLCIDEDSISSHNSSSYSDKIDSDLEAELYSMIHYQDYSSDCPKESIHIESSEIATSVASVTENALNTNNRSTETNFSQNSKSFPHRINTSEKRNEKCRGSAQILSRSLKRKSSDSSDDSEDSVNVNYLDNANLNDSENKLHKDKKKMKRTRNNSDIFNSFKGNDVVIDSSDSDSVIWTDHTTPDKYNIKMNLSNTFDTIIINSDSSNDSFITSTPLTRKESCLNNQSMPNIKIGESLKGKVLNLFLYYCFRYLHIYFYK